MKTTRITFFLSVMMLVAAFGTKVSAQNTEGIQFFHGTFGEALQKAGKEGKLVFVDAYTSWCGPCRWMAANTFTDKAVADYFNQNFVNLKLDMEKGEGPSIARKYAVRAYPTLLFVDSSGGVVKRTMGAKKPDALITFGKEAQESR